MLLLGGRLTNRLERMAEGEVIFTGHTMARDAVEACSMAKMQLQAMSALQPHLRVLEGVEPVIERDGDVWFYRFEVQEVMGGGEG